MVSDLHPMLPEEIIEACKKLKKGERKIFILKIENPQMTGEIVRNLSFTLTTEQWMIVTWEAEVSSVEVFKTHD